jgi:hypothetical protein
MLGPEIGLYRKIRGRVLGYRETAAKLRED